MSKLLVLSLLLIAFPAAGQSERQSRPNERFKAPDYSEYEKLEEKWLEEEDEKKREVDDAIPSLDPPARVPDGWIFDYDYRSDLFKYLGSKHQAASVLNKNTYVYLYADWNDACMLFRKLANSKSYKALFEENEIIMVEYFYLKRKHGVQFSKLPVFLKVHSNGILGPEAIRPVSSTTDHPRKAYYKLKKFLQANAGSR